MQMVQRNQTLFSRYSNAEGDLEYKCAARSGHTLKNEESGRGQLIGAVVNARESNHFFNLEGYRSPPLHGLPWQQRCPSNLDAGSALRIGATPWLLTQESKDELLRAETGGHSNYVARYNCTAAHTDDIAALGRTVRCPSRPSIVARNLVAHERGRSPHDARLHHGYPVRLSLIRAASPAA